MKNDLKIVSVSNVFDNINYLVPIYQRNFAWTEIQIIDKEETFPFMKAIIRFHQKLKEPTGFMTFQVETAEQAMRSSLNVLEKI